MSKTLTAEETARQVYKELAKGKTGAGITMNVIDLASKTATRFASSLLNKFAERIKRDIDAMQDFAIEESSVDIIHSQLLQESGITSKSKNNNNE